MKAVWTFATLLLALILVAAVPRAAVANPSNLFGDGIGAETANSEFHEPGEACGHLDCTESCPSDCLYGAGECCASGLLQHPFQKPLAIAILRVATEATSDFRIGFEPERLPEPP